MHSNHRRPTVPTETETDIALPPASFSLFLMGMDGGDFHSRLSAELQAFVHDLGDHLRDTGEKSCKGKLTVTFAFTLDDRGAVEIKPSLETKLPKPPVNRSFMWVGAGDRLTPNNPRQQQLPFNEVRTPRGAAPQ
jgi:hypothetical protein